MVAVDHPHDALAIASEAAEAASAIGDEVALARVVYRVCDIALDLPDRAVADRWMPGLLSLPHSAADRLEAEALDALYREMVEPRRHPTRQRLAEISDEMVSLAGAWTPEIGAARICVELWQGRLDLAQRMSRTITEIPPLLAHVIELEFGTLSGPPWLGAWPGFGGSTVPHNERALLHRLRGEDSVSDELLRERYTERVADVGHSFQRFTPFFPGAISAALGPAATNPPVASFRTWIDDPPFPGLWVVHRVIVALLLAEKLRDPELARGALETLQQTDADETVRLWISTRAQRLL
jgi:hypothetical protein